MQCTVRDASHRPTFLYDYPRPAIQAGFVEMTQPDSPRSPTQKYRLTEKGRRYLEGEMSDVSSGRGDDAH